MKEKLERPVETGNTSGLTFEEACREYLIPADAKKMIKSIDAKLKGEPNKTFTKAEIKTMIAKKARAEAHTKRKLQGLIPIVERPKGLPRYETQWKLPHEDLSERDRVRLGIHSPNIKASYIKERDFTYEPSSYVDGNVHKPTKQANITPRRSG